MIGEGQFSDAEEDYKADVKNKTNVSCSDSNHNSSSAKRLPIVTSAMMNKSWDAKTEGTKITFNCNGQYDKGVHDEYYDDEDDEYYDNGKYSHIGTYWELGCPKNCT